MKKIFPILLSLILIFLIPMQTFAASNTSLNNNNNTLVLRDFLLL